MSNKLNLNDISCELKLGGLPNIQALNEILHISKEKGLSIYFDVDICGVDAGVGLTDSATRYVRSSGLMLGGDSIDFNDCRKALVTPNICKDEDILVKIFSYADVKYYPADDTGQWYKPKYINYSHFYCISTEFDEYLKKHDSAILHHEEAKSTIKLRDVLTKEMKKRDDLYSAVEDAVKSLLIQDPFTMPTADDIYYLLHGNGDGDDSLHGDGDGDDSLHGDGDYMSVVRFRKRFKAWLK